MARQQGKKQPPLPSEVEIEVVQPPAEVARDEQPNTDEPVEFPSEAEEQEQFDKAIEEHNEFIKSLVQNFVQQEIAGLEERIRDLETLVGSFVDQKASARALPVPGEVAGPPKDVGEPHYDVPEYRPNSGSVEEYSPAHQGGDGTPWYTG